MATEVVTLLPIPHPIVQDRDGQDWYRWKGTCVKPWIAEQYARNKHLTEPELAALYWHQLSGTMVDPSRQETKRRSALYRFAKTAHYNGREE